MMMMACMWPWCMLVQPSAPLAVLSGHSAPVLSLARLQAGAGGAGLVSASADWTACVWPRPRDVNGPRRTLVGHGAAVTCLHVEQVRPAAAPGAAKVSAPEWGAARCGCKRHACLCLPT